MTQKLTREERSEAVAEWNRILNGYGESWSIPVSTTVAVADSYEAEIERLREALEKIAAHCQGRDGADYAHRTARTALQTEEETANIDNQRLRELLVEAGEALRGVIKDYQLRYPDEWDLDDWEWDDPVIANAGPPEWWFSCGRARATLAKIEEELKK